MNNEKQVSAKALELAAMIRGPNQTIGADKNTGATKAVTEDDIRLYLDLALLLEPHIRKED